jgi:hypothetical protein
MSEFESIGFKTWRPRNKEKKQKQKSKGKIKVRFYHLHPSLASNSSVSCATVFGARDITFTLMPVVGSAKRNDTGSFQTKDAVSAAALCSH